MKNYQNMPISNNTIFSNNTRTTTSTRRTTSTLTTRVNNNKTQGIEHENYNNKSMPNTEKLNVFKMQKISAKILSDEMYLKTLRNLNVNTQEEKAAQELMIQLQHYIHGQHSYEIIFKGIQSIFRTI